MARRPYLVFMGVAILLYGSAIAVIVQWADRDERTFALLVLTAIFYIPVTAAGARRLHDTGHSATLMLDPLKPVAAFYIVLFGLMYLAHAFPLIGVLTFGYALISGAFTLVAALVLLVLTTLTLIYFSNTMGRLLLPSDPAANKYGPNPSHEVIQ